MTKFAKFISDTQIKYAQRTLKEPDFVCFNFSSASPEILNSRGYYEVIEDEQPTVEEGYYLRPTYEDCGDHIQVHWVEEEIQEGEE